MKISKASSEDHDKIIALFFENNFALLKLEWFEWKHLQNPCGDSIILKAENDDGEIVATVALIPQKFFYLGKCYTALQAVDGVIKREIRGKRLFSQLMDAILSHRPSGVEDNYFYIGFPGPTNSKKALASSGWKYLMEFKTVEYILRPSKFRSFPGGAILSKVMAIPLMAVRTIMFHGAKVSRFQVKQVSVLPHDFDEQLCSNKVMGIRSASFLQWRVLANPKDHLELFYIVDSSETSVGYVIGRSRRDNYEILEWRFSQNQREGLTEFLRFLYTSNKCASATFIGFQNQESDRGSPPLGLHRCKSGCVVFVHGLEYAGLPSDPSLWDLTLLDSDW